MNLGGTALGSNLGFPPEVDIGDPTSVTKYLDQHPRPRRRKPYAYLDPSAEAGGDTFMDSWARISRLNGREVGSDELHSDTRQIRKAETLANHEGITIREHNIRYNLPGTNSVDELEPLLQRIELSAFSPSIQEYPARLDGLITWKISRLSRDHVQTLQAVRRIKNAGGEVRSTDEPAVDLWSWSGRLLLDIMSSIAAMDREILVEGWNDTHDENVDKGRAHIAPTGYSKRIAPELVLDADGQPILDEHGEPLVWAKGTLVPNADAPYIHTAFVMRARGRV